MQARHGSGVHYRIVHEKGLPVIIFFVLKNSSGAQLREPKLALEMKCCCVVLWRFIATKVL